MTGFLEKAAVSARSNVLSWKKRFPDPAGIDRNPPPGFLPPGNTGCGVIAEVKMQSPSKGDLMGQNDPLCLSVRYESAGAEAVSVVVEERYFGGSPELFVDVAAMTDLPLLWKDFVVDPYQVRLAAGLGASAVLLIAGMLKDVEMVSLLGVAREEGLRPLVEVHDVLELSRALESGADLIGINNRDLVTLEVDLEVSEKLAGQFAPGIQRVSESGIRTSADVQRMAACGYRAVLVGESLVTAEDTEELLGEMVKAGRGAQGAGRESIV